MDFGRAFSFVFQDQNWFKKVILPALCMLIPVIGMFIAMGWTLEVLRREIFNDPTKLPELEFGKNLQVGFFGTLIGFIYSIPAFILYLPLGLSATLSEQLVNSGTIDEQTLAIIIGIMAVCCGGLLLIYSLAISIILPAAYANFIAKNNSFGAAFQFGEIFGLVRSAIGAYLMTFVGLIIGSFIASLGSIACGVGILLTTIYAYAIWGNLMGQAYKQAKGVVSTPMTPYQPSV